jgi:hypothetical protein
VPQGGNVVVQKNYNGKDLPKLSLRTDDKGQALFGLPEPPLPLVAVGAAGTVPLVCPDQRAAGVIV